MYSLLFPILNFKMRAGLGMYRKLTINGDVDTLIQGEVITVNLNRPKKEKRFFRTDSNLERLKQRAARKSASFKEFALEQMFPEEHFKIRKLDNKYKNEPDFLIKHKRKGNEFYVKCKFRGYLFKGHYDWIRKDQLECFKNYSHENKKPVYFALGLSGCAKDPDHVYIMPLENADCKLKLGQMIDWKISDETDIYRILKI